MHDMTKKEVAMKEDSEWNVISAEDTMIMALVSTLKKTVNKKVAKPTKSKSSNKDEDKDKNSTELSAEEQAKRRDAKIQEWKKKAPMADKPTTITKDDKTYHYCIKCRGGKGLWTLHKESEHKDYFKPKSNKTKDTKKVTFSIDKKSSDDDDNELAIKVNKQLLSNAKSYLANINQDFPEGGTQGH